MNKYIFVFCIFCFFGLFNSVLQAQNTNAYLIPRQIYVGDPAVLVLPLPATIQNSPDIVLRNGSSLPTSDSIDFHKITLERRTVGSRLMIEFTAFVPGILEFPVIEIGGEYFDGLQITVHSLINSRVAPVLSGAASSLAMPGTAAMLYGVMAALAIVILGVIWFFYRGRTVLYRLKEKWRYYRLFASMRKNQKSLCRLINKGVDKRVILDLLSEQFREFLSLYTGENCRSMTAQEFENEPIPLKYFFSKCDEMRFSGGTTNTEDILAMLDDLRKFLILMEETRKESQK